MMKKKLFTLGMAAIMAVNVMSFSLPCSASEAAEQSDTEGLVVLLE